MPDLPLFMVQTKSIVILDGAAAGNACQSSSNPHKGPNQNGAGMALPKRITIDIRYG